VENKQMKKQIILKITVGGMNYQFKVSCFKSAFYYVRELEACYGNVTFRFETA
jgi:hypothetical protein